MVVAAAVVAGLLSAIGMASAPTAAAGVDLTQPPVFPEPLPIPGQPVVAAASAGYLPGSGGVGPDGSYGYRIPVDVPDGRAGMAPTLALSYSSRGGDGPMGVGWALNGLSSVDRCGESLSTEGKVSGVDFDASDRVCLDGQKLVAVGDASIPLGQYGASGTQYRTETDSFVRVVSQSDPGSDVAAGPDRFLVYAKSGLISTYLPRTGTQVTSAVGFMPGPTQMTVSSAPRRVNWLLDKVADRSGNEIRYEYENSIAGPTEILLRRITYTWATGANIKAGQRRVEFRYDQDVESTAALKQRPDKSFSFGSGVRHDLTQRLRKIELWAPNPATPALVWRYDITYQLGKSGRSLVSSVTKCGPAAGSGCLRAKKFGYNDPAVVPSFTERSLGTQIVVTDGGIDPAMRVADLNGDGAEDLIYTLGGTYKANSPDYVRLGVKGATGVVPPLTGGYLLQASSGSGWPANLCPACVVSLPDSRPIDVDADGATELMARHSDQTGGWHDTVLRWNDTSKGFASTGITLIPHGSTDFADMDGDGRVDMLTADIPAGLQTWNYSVHLGTGSGFGPPLTGSPGLAYGCRPQVSDIDGDGRAQLTVNPSYGGTTCSDTTYALGLDGNGNPAAPAVSSVYNNITYYQAAPSRYSFSTVAGDFNGDGLDDYLMVRTNYTNPGTFPLENAFVLWGTGRGLVASTVALNLTIDQHYPDVRIADIDNDGRDDIVSLHSATTVYFSRGDGGFQPATIASDTGTIDPQVGRSTTQLADVTGDGLPDLVRIANQTLKVLVQNSAGRAAPDRLASVTDAGTAWTRETVGYSSQWTDHPDKPVGPCGYPTFCLRTGLPVVRQLESRAHVMDPATPTLRQYFSYEDPLVELRGRGFLGFGVVRIWRPQQPAETVLEFDHRRQEDGRYYPGVGHPSKVTTAIPILTADQVDAVPKPTTATARVVRSRSADLVKKPYTSAGGPIVYQVLDASGYSTTWEEGVGLEWTLGGTALSEHVTGIQEPSVPLRRFNHNAIYDNYGNATSSSRWTTNGVTETAVIGFGDQPNRLAQWQVGLASDLTLSRIEPGGARVDRRVNFTYDNGSYAVPQRGLLTKVETERDNADPTVRSTTTYGYDGLGVQRSTLTSAPGMSNVSGHVEYAPVFPGQPDEEVYSSQSWYDHAVPPGGDPAVDYRPSSWQAVHPAYGMPVATLDANGVGAGMVNDDLGRPVKVTVDGQGDTTFSYANLPAPLNYTNGTVVSTSHAGITTTASTDALGRPVQTTVTGFDGTASAASSVFDVLGRVVSQAAPAPGGTVGHAYDSLNREVLTTLPDGKTDTFSYGLTAAESVVQVTDPAGRIGVRHFDRDGRIVASTGKLTKLDGTVADLTNTTTYAPFDLPATFTDPDGHLTSMSYDVLGRQTKLVEPDRGTTDIGYFGTGETHTVSRGVAGTTTYTYDDLARPTASGNTVDGVSVYRYDTAAHGIGKPAWASSPFGIRTDYRYDTAGRNTGTDLTDLSTPGTVYSTDSTYDDATGRPTGLEYPDPDQGGPAARLRLTYGYTQPGGVSHGYATTVTMTTPGQAQQQLWSVTARKPNLGLAAGVLGSGSGAVTLTRSYDPGTARLHSQTATSAAGAVLQDITYGYTAGGQVNTRTQTATGVVPRAETYGYDTLGRLTDWTLKNGNAAEKKTHYTFDNIGNLRFAGDEERAFGTPSGAQPHTLTWHDRMVGGIETFDYDGRGRQVARHDEAGAMTRQIDYTAFDLPKTVTTGGNTVTYAYDAFGRKVKETTRDAAGAITASTFYVPGHYEKRTVVGQPTKHVYYLEGTDGPIGQATYDGSTTTVDYQLTDRLGSVTAELGPAGVDQPFYYDPWGSRVNADGTAFTGSTGDTTHGFTGFEHDAAVGLINANGRVLDPALKVFTTPDPLNGPAANPYAYAGNDPTNAVDPSGYSACNVGSSGSECDNPHAASRNPAVTPFTALGPSPDNHGSYNGYVTAAAAADKASNQGVVLTDTNRYQVTAKLAFQLVTKERKCDGYPCMPDGKTPDYLGNITVCAGQPCDDEGVGDGSGGDGGSSADGSSGAGGGSGEADGDGAGDAGGGTGDGGGGTGVAGGYAEPTGGGATGAGGETQLTCAGVLGCGSDSQMLVKLFVEPTVWLVHLLLGGGSANAVAINEEGVNSRSSLAIVGGAVLGAAMIVGGARGSAAGREAPAVMRGQVGSASRCGPISEQIAEANPGVAEVVVVGNTSNPASALAPSMPIGHVAVRLRNGMIRDHSLLGNALNYHRTGTLLPDPAYIQKIADPVARAAAKSLGSRDTFTLGEYLQLLKDLFPPRAGGG
jgi:RHS repeat-associated protein